VGSTCVADPHLPILLLHVPHSSLLWSYLPARPREAQLSGVPSPGAPQGRWLWAGCAYLDTTLLPWAALGWGLAQGWQSKWRSGGRGDGDAGSCHRQSAPCFVLRDQNAIAMVLIWLRSELDPEASPAALASAFFVPAFPLLPDSRLSPFTSPA